MHLNIEWTIRRNNRATYVSILTAVVAAEEMSGVGNYIVLYAVSSYLLLCSSDHYRYTV